ncbi:DUF4907 domain-containing protein [Flavobacterium eburneipallidum]|uniref:DUF4907 domain-containing protein n=1 Tax=Flavobacterium eburneipallidum TaxID=3003263 RepID=UPI0022ABDD02|nr:DUF4907 domain-containing protein [Flavobacterium eburneipallidum]
MKLLKLIFVFLLLVSCHQKPVYELESFQVDEGWGYTIAVNHKVLIKQTVIPTLSKQESFKSRTDALKVGNLVLERIKQNLSPTIAKKDLILLEIAL